MSQFLRRDKTFDSLEIVEYRCREFSVNKQAEWYRRSVERLTQT